jgi:hypothetical protein
MVSQEATQMKNEILRKIKLHKAKRTQFLDLTRKKKEEIISERNQKFKDKH